MLRIGSSRLSRVPILLGSNIRLVQTRKSSPSPAESTKIPPQTPQLSVLTDPPKPDNSNSKLMSTWEISGLIWTHYISLAIGIGTSNPFVSPMIARLYRSLLNRAYRDTPSEKVLNAKPTLSIDPSAELVACP